MQERDLIVIGGGAGGMAAAEAGVRRGARTLLIQDGPIGGDCTWTGCVPSKALIAAAARGADVAEGLANARRAVLEVAALETADVFRDLGVEVVEGRARFVSPTMVEVGDERFRSERFVIATGATPVVPPIDGLREADPRTSDTIWELERTPTSLAVLGGGPIGVELAQAFARLGVAVTLFEGMDQILGREEPATAELIADRLRADGVTVITGRFVERVQRLPDGRVRVTAAESDPVEADEVLVAIGRRPVTDGLDVDVAGVRLDDEGHVETDDHLRTSAPGTYAVGDVTGRLPFTHGAYAMGRIAAANALSRIAWRTFDPTPIPWVTFTSPEVARVGMTEAEAHAAHGDKARVVELPLSRVDRALAEVATTGFVKLITGPRRLIGGIAGGEFVGATIVAPHAGEMIHEISNAMATSTFPARLALASHAYPTWSMAVQQAVAALFVEVNGVEARPARPG